MSVYIKTAGGRIMRTASSVASAEAICCSLSEIPLMCANVTELEAARLRRLCECRDWLANDL